MRYLALATDYDGTLAHDGRVADATVAALIRLRKSGRRLLLVTGRDLPDLQALFPHMHLFDRIVAENGALLYRPATRDETLLSTTPPATFLDELRRRGVRPLSAGRAIVATTEPHLSTVLDTIRHLGLNLQLTFNKGAITVLPPGIDKASGSQAALRELCIAPHNTIGVGDAENDHPLLAHCGYAVAVANALPALKEQANHVTTGEHGAGIVELIESLIAGTLAEPA
jgi:HAD superfamily hydrolase (TIGR01484 family)